MVILFDGIDAYFNGASMFWGASSYGCDAMFSVIMLETFLFLLVIIVGLCLSFDAVRKIKKCKNSTDD